MKHFRLPAFAFAAIALLAACGTRDPVADEANSTGPATVTNDSSGAIAGGPPGPAANGSSEVPAGPIPAAIHGRWSLTPADCTSTRGDAKGLLEINADSLKFYESRAVPTTSIEAGGQGISGNFDFTGEGQNWSKYVSLKIQGDGLVRTERNPMASYTYVRCE